jgi:hypothetical protein
LKINLVTLILVTLILIGAGWLAAADNQAISRYHDKDLIAVRAKLRFTTLIVFPEGEEISEVSCGDKEFWVIDGKDNLLHIKPAREGAVTNLNVVLKSKNVYSFLVQEGGSKEVPDLKIVVGPDATMRLRKETETLQADMKRAAAEYEKKLAAAEEEKKRIAAESLGALADAEKALPNRILDFLASQKFSYACIVKTNICLAAEFSTATYTLIVGNMFGSPTFSGWDKDGKYYPNVSFERKGNFFMLKTPLVSGSISYGGKQAGFSMR